MTQHSKIIDVTKSFKVTDPNAFAENLSFSTSEDTVEKGDPIQAYEGYNFLPTSYGYKSFFGTDSVLDIVALTPRCDRVLLFQLATYQNILVALCEDGIWVAYPGISSNIWKHEVTQSIPTAGTYKEWTYCIIENSLYCYREGDNLVHKCSFTGTALSVAIVPTTAVLSAPVASAVPSTVAGTFAVSVAQYTAGVPSSLVSSLGNLTLALGDSFDISLGGYIGDAILYFQDSVTGIIYKKVIVGLTVLAQNFTALSVLAADAKAQGLPDPEAYDHWTNFTPTFLNMAGQKGIFRANLRLGFWDSANSVSWSDLFALNNFTPSVQTLAGNATFAGVLGNIVTIKSQGDNFVIYSSKGIVGVRYANTAAMLWEANVISDTAGIWYDHEVTTGINENEHYAYTNTGIKHIGSYNVLNKAHVFEEILTDVYDLLREARQPVYLDFINGRYLCFSLINSDYINGKVSFVYNTVDSVLVRTLVGGLPWDGVFILPTTIGAQSATSHIGGQLTAAAMFGMYTRWTATGSKVGSNSPSAIEPYNLDSAYAHIPNTPVLTADISPATAQSIVSSQSGWNLGTTPVVSPVAKQLGWNYPGLNNISSVFLGLTDTYLNSFINTQVAEWQNFETIQTASIANLNATTPETGVTINGTTPYYSVAAVNAAIIVAADAYAASLVGTYPDAVRVGNTVTWSEPISTILSGAHTTGANTFTGVGTYSAGFSKSAVFTGGFDVRRNRIRTFSSRAVANVQSYQFFLPNSAAAYPWSPAVPDFTQISLISRADAIAQALLAVTPASTAVVGVTTYSIYTPVRSGGGTGENIYYSWSQNGVPQGTPFQIYLNTTYSSPLITVYYIDHATTNSLSLTANPSVTFTSTMTASQTVLEWGYFTPTQIQYGAVGNFTSSYGAITIPGTGILGTSTLPLDLNIVYPGATYVLRDGSPAPLYPTFVGALVFDTALKKWGKMKANYRCLLDYNPVNTLNGSLSYTSFGMDMAMLEPVATGRIRTFDSRPSDCWMRYGKLGFYRQGFTQAQEIKIHFRSSSTGIIELDSSLDGRALEFSLTETYPFTLAASVTGYFGNSGRWHTIKISGQFDLQYLEFRGNVAGRR